jgi:predicted Rossmann fold nucleotide-binding protein DprA/Smf involved in DNA uptake
VVSDYYRESFGPLFDAVATSQSATKYHWRARRTDPETSHEAAAGVHEFEADHHAQILEALRLGPAGATEIASRCGLGRDQVGKRLCELVRDGLVVIDGKVRNDKGRSEARYRSAKDGR